MNCADVPIESPCSADWNAMDGSDKRRFCASCTLHVHDLPAMTRDEAETLLDDEGDLCVRDGVDTQGEIAFRPAKRLRRGLLGAIVGLGMLVATPASGCAERTPALNSTPVTSNDASSLIGKVVSIVRQAVFDEETPQDDRIIEQVLLGGMRVERSEPKMGKIARIPGD